MCFGLLNYLLTRATTPTPFSHYDITNWYSDDIKKHLKKLHMPVSIAHLNPLDPIDEMALLESPQSGNAIQRNYRFLTRRMLNHFDRFNISEYFKGRKQINILSIGCGFAFDVIPLEVYFSYHGISMHYTGVDIESKIINTANKTFSQFENVSFINSDICNLAENFRYDLIIIQHPNFLHESDIFQDIFHNHIMSRLAENGHVYASFYYEKEWEQFKANILPSWKPILGDLEIQSKDLASLRDRFTGLTYAPEKFVYFSSQPYQSALHQSVLATNDESQVDHSRKRMRA